ncbi:MAG: hypothetical protein MUC44_05300 [Beijerinckiaceae bacterium]|nr:hypothetical protein [Beijerinckiaceae bacterium]
MGLAGFGFLAICLLFAWCCWYGRGGAGPTSGVAVVRSLVPPLLLGWCLLLGARSPLADSLRLQPLAIDAVVQPDTMLFRVGSGGDQGAQDGQTAGQTPDIMVPAGRGAMPDEPYQDIAIVKGSADGRGSDLALFSRTVPGGVILASFKEGDDRHFIGTVILEAGDTVCLNRCADKFRFDGKGGFVRTRDKVRKALPTRTGPAGWLAPWPASSAIYPLHAALLDQASPTASSFMFQHFAEGPLPFIRGPSRWHLAIMDADVRVERDGRQLQALTCDRRPCGHSTLKRGITIARVNFDRSAPVPACGTPAPAADSLAFFLGENPNPRCRLIDRKRLTLAAGAGAFQGKPLASLELAAPEVVALGHAPGRTPALFQADTPNDDMVMRSRLIEQSDDAGPDTFTIDTIVGAGRPGSALEAAANDFPGALRRALSGSAATATPGIEAVPCNISYTWEFCAGDSRHSIRFALDEMRLPWLLFWVCAAAALCFHALCRQIWASDPAFGIILAIAQFLLALRAIIGIEGVMIDPDIPWRAVYAELATAMVALPSVLIAWRLPSDDWRRLLGLAAFNVMAAAGIDRWLGTLSMLGLVLLGVAVAAMLLRLGASTGLTRPIGPIIMRIGRRLPIWGWSVEVWLILLIIARGALPLIGFKERLGPIAISAIYLPLLLLGLARLAAVAAQDPAQRQPRAMRFLALALAGAAMPALARDTGFPLVHLWPILGVASWLGWLWWRQGDRRGGLVWLVPGPALAVSSYALLIAVVLLAFRPPSPVANPAAMTNEALNEALDYSNEKNSANLIRLIAVVRPDWVPQIGNRAASQQMAQTIHLVQRTQDMFRDDYMRPSNLPIRQQPNLSALRDVHLTDNVAAVHLMAPFGRSAAFGLLLVLLVAAAAVCSERDVKFWTRPKAVAGALAIWTVFGAATYMVLANLLLVPFTGRNIYLLAPSSGSDLVEGLLLLMMATVGLTAERKA